jgi:regulation of enolase protein 1 (concanavalin A-like superfamily)
MPLSRFLPRRHLARHAPWQRSPEDRRRRRLLLERLEDRTLLDNGLPILHSLPNSPVAIYLDYNGGTYGGSHYDTYDEDGDPTTFNAAEQAHITEGWRQTASYFSMFDIDVTTERPHVPFAWEIISRSINNGYSYVGVFPNSSPESFVQDYFTRTRQSGMAHELGHNFGLWHQSDYDALGNKVNEYSSGYDSLHGPIMGLDYARLVHKWFLGHGSDNISHLQDDIATIAAQVRRFEPPGRDGFHPDLYGSTFDTATPLTFQGNVQAVSSIIARMTHTDAFSFVSAGGRYNIAAEPRLPSGLALKLDIYNSDQQLIAAGDGPTNGQQLVMDLPGGLYYAFVSSHADYGDLGEYNLNVSTLPQGWSTRDLGFVGAAGSAAFDDSTGTFTLQGSGDDIWNNADAFRFASQTLTGDGSITARVVSLQNTDQYAKAGVTIRESLDPGSRHTDLVLTPGSGIYFQDRLTTGGPSASPASYGSARAPYWVRLVRSGDTISSFRSSDGLNWFPVGSVTLALNDSVRIGLELTSHNNTLSATATFDNVTLTGQLGDPDPVYNDLPAPANLTPSLGDGTDINLNWDAVAGATGYRVERSADGVGWQVAGYTSADETSFNDHDLFGSRRWFYRVSSLDDTGQSVPSDVANIVNRPRAPFGLSIISWQTNGLILDWRDVSGDTGYRVEHSLDGENFTTAGITGTNVNSFTDTGLTPGTLVYYRVAAMSPEGDSLYSAVISGASRLPAVTGLTFTTVSTNQLAFEWNPLAGASAYQIERSTDGVNYSRIAVVTDPAFVDTAVRPLRAYHYRIRGTSDVAVGLNSAPFYAATPSPVGLPDGWTSQDVGGVAGPGAAGYVGGTWTLLGSGDDIWNNADAFRFASQTLIGDGSITARVVSLQNTDQYAKAGVMIRESLDSGSRHAALVLTPGSGVYFEDRLTTGGPSASPASDGSARAPYWVRLVRTGDTIQAFRSSDGVSWTSMGSVNIPMNTTVYIGLVLTSHNNSRLSIAAFTNVVVTSGGGTGPYLPGGGEHAPVSLPDAGLLKTLEGLARGAVGDVGWWGVGSERLTAVAFAPGSAAGLDHPGSGAGPITPWSAWDRSAGPPTVRPGKTAESETEWPGVDWF